MSHNAQFYARIELLPSMLSWVRECLIQSAIDDSTRKKVELAMEEALVNIIKHGYTTTQGTIELSCAIHPNDKIVFVIKDQGKAFNPLEHIPTIDKDSPLEERKEGGLGVHLIRHYMDDVTYIRQNGYNILTLIKKLF